MAILLRDVPRASRAADQTPQWLWYGTPRDDPRILRPAGACRVRAPRRPWAPCATVLPCGGPATTARPPSASASKSLPARVLARDARRPEAPRRLAVGAASHSVEPVHPRSSKESSGTSARPGSVARTPPVHAPSARRSCARAAASPTCTTTVRASTPSCSRPASRGLGRGLTAPLEHPLQRIAAQLAWMGHTPSHAVDGAAPTRPAARGGAWGRVAEAMDDVVERPRGRPVDATTQARRAAMAAHPELTSGTGRLTSTWCRAAREPMAVKIGAMGLSHLVPPGAADGPAVKSTGRGL